jgi:arabinogalactan endo-1,4-beta-galactosidase
LIEGYPATPEGQRKFMIDITQLVVDAAASAPSYWEPFWVSTHCGTRWGKGSDWENATWVRLPAARGAAGVRLPAP